MLSVVAEAENEKHRESAVAADGGGVLNGPGSVYVFSRIAGRWTERLKLLASDGRNDDHLGYFRSGVQISGTTVLAGAPQDTTPGMAGAAYVFDIYFPSFMIPVGIFGGGAGGLLTALPLILCRRRMA